ncbi:beta-N-acetylhexosaminidase [Sphingobacterium siyangense]|uniref:beta-N-acetylhexosaminidase n=1 Tax=Sphingobacterium siyangense TaxID=459529 RepID=UPI003DA5A3EF
MIELKSLFVIVSCLLSGTIAFAQSNLSLVPFPKEVVVKAGGVDMAKGVHIDVPQSVEQLVQTGLRDRLGWKITKSGIPLKMMLAVGDNDHPESYKIRVNTSGIYIEAPQEAGLIYGLQTFLQLGIQYTDRLPILEIKDEPRFSWRAYMLDEGRYFQGKEAVLKLLDEMALLKMNVFHWHLTDDAGWRIEIKKYPLLTKVGSKRDSSQINVNGKKWESKIYDGRVHAGYYTQEEIKEIVAYAKARNITIVPEINMPGHASAAVASYPWLGTSKEKIKVPTKFGVVTTVFDVSDPKVIQFLHEVLEEVAGLFPGEVIHIGGDEVKYDQWKESASINAYMGANNLADFSDLQVFFTNNISNFIEKSLNRRTMGWNEIMGLRTHAYQNTKNATTQLSKNAIIHFWRGTTKDFDTALARGYQIVNSNHAETYIDYTYKEIGLSKAYQFDPVPDGLDSIKQKNIIGLGCQMWGEWTPSFNEVTYQTFPRIAAYAETAWSPPQTKDYNRFKKNLLSLFQHWKQKGYHIPDKSEWGL